MTETEAKDANSESNYAGVANFKQPLNNIRFSSPYIYMKFSLIFYTDDWDVGPTIELGHIPAPGNVIWTKNRKSGDDDTDMYYVDNVMYAEKGMDREEVIYLYVRPYKGYTEYAPMTESDRITEKLEKLTQETERLRELVTKLTMDN